MLRKFAVAAVLAVLTATQAAAGVICYGEGSLGKNMTVVDAGPNALANEFGFDGLNAGVGIGCDYGIGAAVIGIAARYDILDVEGADSSDHLWSILGRAGIKINPGTLVYGLAGIAGTEMTYDGIGEDTTGILLGAGLEFDIAVKNLTFFAEYNRIMWDEKSMGVGADVKSDTDMVRAGLRLKFDFNGLIDGK